MRGSLPLARTRLTETRGQGLAFSVWNSPPRSGSDPSSRHRERAGRAPSADVMAEREHADRAADLRGKCAGPCTRDAEGSASHLCSAEELEVPAGAQG